MTVQNEGRPLTGRHVLAMFVAGFGIIIAVNLVLAFNAVRTFPGLEVPNSYVASQSFDARRAAQDALGWGASAQYRDGRLTIAITDRTGQLQYPEDLTVTVGRPTESAEDVTPHFDSELSAPLDLASGLWRVDVLAHAMDGTLFEQQLIVSIAK
ncbi:FixH family protein [Puniceibacterium sediminis]|uniref:Nitrogen fixation protein FixH n=1 Tax=Puniceibacterium sediminis TaxID=1608407 RepID=A0A238VDR3_9RHOB|nr:FixH family protein [Puniceibacterium sediminis]SNR32552.1 Nitrogen fixation protein FixH [Puniceibacterium sediminis]